MSSKSMNNKVLEDWPSDGLEKNPFCPVCHSGLRAVLHTDLTDRVFKCAPGKWTLYTCLDCGSAYLDPRPNEQTIHRAYQTYFTHDDNLDEQASTKQSFIQKFRTVHLTNGYRNWRFGTSYKPSNSLGILAATLKPEIKHRIDAQMRYLPKPDKGAKLLDFGCGNGSFLSLAKDAGWDVNGIDFDTKAVDVARQKKLNVCVGGLDTLADLNEEFDVITLSHVLEHVHDPKRLLELCYKRLKKGGCLWIETPNINAYGHQLYGESWRELDPPRHLILFTPESLISLLQMVGFKRVKLIKAKLPSELVEMIFSESEKIRAGANILDDAKDTTFNKQANHHSHREFITLFALK